MSKKVTWISCNRLSCASAESPEVIICLTDSDLVAPHLCPESDAESPFAFSYIEGTLVRVDRNAGNCNSGAFHHLVSYDEAQLADPDTALTSAQISGMICKGCLTNYFEELAGDEVYVDGDGLLHSQHGCTYEVGGSGSSFITSILDTNSVNLTVASGVLSADSKISATAGNQITINSDGLYVPEGNVTIAPCYLEGFGPLFNNRLKMTDDGLYAIPYVGVETSDIILEVGVNEGPCDKIAEIIAFLKYSEDPGNIAESRDDGIYVPASGITAYSIRTETGPGTITIDASDYTLLVDATAGNCTVPLPAGALSGSVFNIKKIDSSANTVTASSPSDLIDGATTYVLTVQYESVTIQSDGTTWWVL